MQFQSSDGNLVLSKASTGQALWASNKSNGQGLYFQADGNLVLKWNGGTYTDAIAAVGTGGGIVSNNFGKFK